MKQLFLVLLFVPSVVYCQDEQKSAKEKRLIVVGGIGFPDWAHLGLNYSLGHHFTVGSSLGRSVVNGEVALQFGRKSLYVDRPVFYWSQRLNYYSTKNRSAFFTSGIGKNLYIEKNFGINIDAGITTQIYYKEDKASCAPECDGRGLPGIFPSARLQFFFKVL
jgi:hypothetical protein